MEVFWTHKSSKKFLEFVFVGKLLENEAKNGIVVWKNKMKEARDGKVPLIWNCLQMTGYERQSRILWQAALGDMKTRIDAVWLITTSKYFQVAAYLMGHMMPFKIYTVTSEDQITVL